jgi:hypothetical protein
MFPGNLVRCLERYQQNGDSLEKMGPSSFASRAGKHQGFLSYLHQLLTLFKEFVLSLIGIASALGQPLVIPIIIRTLARSLAFVDDQYLPFRLKPGFLNTLDAGSHHLVPNYKLQW